ncbi:MAG TPA: GNAT family N-acetyltransferase [Vicinamibacterales bacterium]|nr:GNAT family N-acetyltransferase [Vicinamibacterales bacterium]
MTTLTISIEPSASTSVSEHVLGLLEESNAALNFARAEKHFCATLRGPEGTIEGGIAARSFWGWLYIVALAIKPSWRGHGYGLRLLAEAEAWGRDCDCRNAWLMTMSFQAREFYERAGYVVFAELPDYPDAERRLFMRKSLEPSSPDASN